jgi:paraquat-inducible protein B
MADQENPQTAIPESRTVPRRQTRFSLVWIIPVLATVIGLWVAVSRIRSQGPEITIIFQTAEGLDAGKTRINYRGVDVGTITSIRLSPDHRRVIATAQMAPRTESFLVEDTRFWVVRPRISGATISGLGTLISGAYIGMEIGSSTTPKRNFVALEKPPVVTGEAPGHFYLLKTSDLGSLDLGTPVFFRRLQVGQVSSYSLDQNGKFFTVNIFVRAPYDRFVTTDTRFWQSSGIQVQLTANGLSVETQSLLSILIGGISFETPGEAPFPAAAAANSVFTLFTTRARAFEPAAQNPITFRLIFNESVRGLAPGAPVEFRGVQIGEVAYVHAQIDLRTLQFQAPVTIHIDAQRLGIKAVDIPLGTDVKELRRRLIDSLVAHGVRAQLRTGNLITGAAYISFDYFPDAPPVSVNWSEKPVQLPTEPGQLEATEARVTNIVKKLDRMPLEEIGNELRKSLADLDVTLRNANRMISTANETLVSAHGTLQNANAYLEPDSVKSQELDDTLQEVNRAARSIRLLTDYLQRHPEALLRGKRGEAQ